MPEEARSTISRRSVLAGSGVTVLGSLSGCVGELPSPLTSADFYITPIGDIQFVLSFGAIGRIRELVSDDVGHVTDSRESLDSDAPVRIKDGVGSIPWNTRYATTAEDLQPVLEAAENVANPEAVAQTYASESQTGVGITADEDIRVFGQIEGAVASIDAESLTESQTIQLPSIVFDGETSVEPGDVQIQFPDGMVHQYPLSQIDETGLAEVSGGGSSDWTGAYDLSLTDNQLQAERSAVSTSTFQIDPSGVLPVGSLPTTGNGETVLVPEVEVQLHPGLPAVAEAWTLLATLSLAVSNKTSDPESVGNVTWSWATQGLEAGTAGIGPDPTISPVGNLAPVGLVSELGASSAGAGLVGQQLNVLVALETARRKTQEFDALSQDVVEETSTFLETAPATDAGAGVWADRALLAQIVTTHVLPTIAVGAAEDGLEFINALASDFGQVQNDINPRWPLKQGVEQEYQALRNLLSALEESIGGLTTVEPSLATPHEDVLKAVGEEN